MAISPNIQDRHFDWKRGGFVPPIEPYHLRGKSPNQMKVTPKQKAPITSKKKMNFLP